MASLEIVKRVATSIAIVIVAVCALSTAEQAHAAGSVEVDASDLDLSGRSGLFVLYRRLQDASMQSCDPSGQEKVLPWYGRPESGDCYVDTLQATLTNYENDALERIHYELQLNPVIID